MVMIAKALCMCANGSRSRSRKIFAGGGCRGDDLFITVDGKLPESTKVRASKQASVAQISNLGAVIGWLGRGCSVFASSFSSAI